MRKHLLALALSLLAGCGDRREPFTGQQTQAGTTCSAAGSATFQLTVTNLPSGANATTFSGTMTVGTENVTLTPNASTAGALLSGRVTPGKSYATVLKNGTTTFFTGTINITGNLCAYTATVNFQTGALNGGG